MGRNDPGSKSAIRKGCTCPVEDNNFGKGVNNLDNEPMFWMNQDCPLHGNDQDTDEVEDELDRYLLPRA